MHQKKKRERERERMNNGKHGVECLGYKTIISYPFFLHIKFYLNFLFYLSRTSGLLNLFYSSDGDYLILRM